MARSKQFVASLLVALVAASVPAANRRNVRRPSDYSDEERIVMRTDRSLAAERVRTATQKLAIRPGSRAPMWTDVIVGREHPELLLRTELFETLVMDGFLRSGWREFYAKRIPAAGLPSDFWQQLRVAAGPYLDDLESQSARLEQAKQHPEQRRKIEDQISGAYPTLCHDRLLALNRARAVFGGALDRLLYDYVATKTTLFIDDFESADLLRSQSRGCQ